LPLSLEAPAAPFLHAALASLRNFASFYQKTPRPSVAGMPTAAPIRANGASQLFAFSDSAARRGWQQRSNGSGSKTILTCDGLYNLEVFVVLGKFGERVCYSELPEWSGI